MKNSLHLGGTTLTSAGHMTGKEDSDIPTRRYVDRWHEPDIGADEDDHYQRMITSRVWLTIPLTRLCKLSTSLQVGGGKIYSIIEGYNYSNSFYFGNGGVQDKEIKVVYLKEVWVDEWIFETHTKVDIQIVFKWQASDSDDEGTAAAVWTDIGDATFTCTDPSPMEKTITNNMGRWKFRNQTTPVGKKRYSRWRLMGVSGTMSSTCYVNSMLMYIS